MRSLLPSGSINTRYGNYSPDLETGSSNLQGDGAGVLWGEVWGTEGLKRASVLGGLHELLDHQLYYPVEFTDNSIQGTVDAKLFFDKEGKFLADKLSIHGTSNFLQVFVARIIRYSLRDRSEWKPPPQLRPLSVRCRFIFEIRPHLALVQTTNFLGVRGKTGPVATKSYKSSEIEKNTFVTSKYLSFYRYHNPIDFIGVYSQTDEQTHQTTTGAGINILPLVTKGASWIGKTLGLIHENDPLDRYRDDPAWNN